MQVLNITVEHIFLFFVFTDMRKAVDELAAIVQQNFQLEPFSNNLFIFCGRRHDRFKALLWRGDGFLLLYKRLDNGRFRWPQKQEDVISITEQQLRWLLEGLDICQTNAVKHIFPKHTI